MHNEDRKECFAEAIIRIFDEMRYQMTPRCEIRGCENIPVKMWHGLMICDKHDFVLLGFADKMDSALGRGEDA